MKHLDILDFIQKSDIAISTSALSQIFGLAKSNIRKRLKIHIESGEIAMRKDNHAHCFYATEKDYREKVQPRTYDFKPLQHHVSALGTRAGSNEHLEHKSKYN